MGKKIKLLFLVFLVALAINSNAQVYLDSLNSQSKHMLRAFSDQDYNTLLRYTHPKVLELMGGEQKEADLRVLIPEISKDLVIPKSETSYH